MRPGRRSLDVALCAAFLLALCAPALDWLVRGAPPRRRLPEERMSAPFPRPPRAWIGAAQYARAFED